ncbi:MAG: hypothetical protein M0Z63_09465 [Actinomycetota bacterium]|nr:hypothetical protein [Actinomycetota bacterium]
MTVVALCSVKGSPGVTTLACLLGAVWPVGTPVVVAECDPAGGDVAARFGLQGRTGMASFALAARRAGEPLEVEPHLQYLPGGLEILVGARPMEAARAVDAETGGVDALLRLERDVIVDCGRIAPDASGQRLLLARADAVVIVARSDVSSLGHVETAAARLRQERSGALALALVTGLRHAPRSAGRGLPLDLAVTIPDDRAAAAIVRGEAGSRRRLARSPLVEASERLRRWISASTVATSSAARTARPFAARPVTGQPVSGQSLSGQPLSGQSLPGDPAAGWPEPASWAQSAGSGVPIEPSGTWP